MDFINKVYQLGLSLFFATVTLALVWSILVFAEDPPGTLDTSFNGTGVVTTSIGSSNSYASDIAIQPDGKIVVAGATREDFAVVRYKVDGSLDMSFNSTGIVTTSIYDLYDGPASRSRSKT